MAPVSRWPTAAQALLLQTCFLPAVQAADSWARLRPHFDLDGLRAEPGTLLPMLYRRLAQIDDGHPDLGRLKGVYRKAWYGNHGRLRALQPVLRRLADNGVPVTLSGGAAVLVGHLQDVGLRPLYSVDLEVAEPDVTEVAQTFVQHGWRVGSAWRDGHLLDRGGLALRNARQEVCTLRWSAHGPGRDRAEPPEVATYQADCAETSFVVTGSEQLFLGVCVDRDRSIDRRRVRLLADLTSILNGRRPPEAGRLVELAAARRAVGAVDVTWRYLADQLGVTALSPDLRATVRARSGRGDRYLDHAQDLGMLPGSAAAYLRRTGGNGVAQPARGVQAYLREVWELPAGVSVSAAAGRRLWARVGKARPSEADQRSV